MRTPATLLLLTFLLCSPLPAQLVELGAEVGTTIPTGTSERNSGWVAGAYAGFPVLAPFALRFELHYASETGRIESGSTTGASAEYSFDYLQFPIALQFDLGEGSFRPFVYAGTTLGTILSATRSDGLAGEDLSATDLSLDLGGGLRLGIADGLSVGADLRYSYVFASLDRSQVLEASAWKPRSLKLLGGIYFGI